MAFKKLLVKNNWMHLTYYDPDHPDKELSFPPLYVVHVRWPDKYISDEPIYIVAREDWYSDHGHRYSVGNSIPHVRADVHGIPVLIPLTDLEIWFED